MIYHRLTVKLIAAFAAAVIIPGIVLGIIATRALRHEESYLEQRLEDTLRVEVDQAVELIRNEIASIGDQLSLGLESIGGEGDDAAFKAWKEDSELVEVPFLVSRENRILWPRKDQEVSSDEDTFLAYNRDFLTDQASIQTFQNIAYLPEDDSSGMDRSAENEEGGYTGEDSSLDLKKAMAHSGLKGKLDQAKFRSSREVQSKLYQQAEYEKKEVLERNVITRQQATVGTTVETKPEKSILVAERLNLSRITADADQGFIPRLTGSKLEIFFWKKIPPEGEIAGCLINIKAFTEKILAVLPVPYSATRLMTVLDQNGDPLIDPLDEAAGREWKRPFFAREIGEVLPRWEVAAYLTDPAALASRARLQSLIIGVLIAFLLIAILLGGFLIFRSVNQEILLAQQKTTFAANVSHELKTPLTSIRLFAEILEKGRQPDREKQQHYLKLMVSESKRLSRLINTVLDFSRIERGEKAYHKKKIDLAEVVRRAVENLKVPLEEKGFTVRSQIPEIPVPVLGDPEALEQVLINLLANAEKYSGKIRAIEIGLTVESSRALITVIDRGIGISKGEAKKIFKKFYRVDNRLTTRVKGTGLGLTIALAIVRDHKGELTYQPREGGGSSFSITLPIIK
jgi:signal transduction histidine kinase